MILLAFVVSGEGNTLNPGNSLPPTSHRFSKLVIRVAYDKLLHPGFNATITALHQTVWITSIRQGKPPKHCVMPKATRKSPNLCSPTRIEGLRETIFTVTGVNFARPPYVQSDNGETTSYNIFGSLLVQSQGHFIWKFFFSNPTDSSFHQFRRFSSRKSLPVVVIPDRASTDLVSADTLRKLLHSLSI